MKKCEFCKKEFEDNIKFCTRCGNPLKEIEYETEEVKTVNKVECPNCHETVNDYKFCSICGCDMESFSAVALSEEDKKKVCPKCRHIIDNEDAAFCEVCGTPLNGEVKSVKNMIAKSAIKVKDNELVKAVRQDISDSNSIKVIKDKTKKITEGRKVSAPKGKAKTIIITAVAVAFIIVGIAVALNILHCEECNKLHFGNNHKTSESTSENDNQTEDKTSETQNDNVEGTPDNSVADVWSVNYYVDDFNQPTNEWFITNDVLFTGSFSNSATTDSVLTSRVIVDFEKKITFFLYEYGRNEVKNSSEYNVDVYDIVMRTPDGTDHKMTGTLYCGGDRIVIDDNYVNEVLTALKGEGDVLFRFVKSDRTVETYLIKVHTADFADEYATKQN